MDYAKMISSVAGGMKDGSSSRNTEAQAMMADVGAALDETQNKTDAAYRDAFTNYMNAANQNLAQREMAAGAAAAEAARSAGPAPAPAMATGAAMGAGPVAGQVTAQQAMQAQMARAALGQNMGAPGPSAALSNVQIDPRTGLAVAGGGGVPMAAATPYPAVGAIYGNGQPLDDSALQAAYLRNRGI